MADARRRASARRPAPEPEPTSPPAATSEAEAMLADKYVSYRDEANGIKEEAGYFEGKVEGEGDDRIVIEPGILTGVLFSKLEPLLFRPTPPAYIQHRAGGEGNPYPTTGLTSTQVQVDRMNDVLGRRHWRTLLHYAQQGTLCKAVVVVGNSLEYCRLDDTGDLITWSTIGEGERAFTGIADVVAVHEGWGGWKSRTVGDTFKSSETNALKRVLARFGPGADVYRVDYEEDILAALKGEQPTETQYQAQQPRGQRRDAGQRRDGGTRREQPQQQAVAQQAPPQPRPPTEEEARKLLEALLEEEAWLELGEERIDLREIRREVYEAMMEIPEDRGRPTIVNQWTLLSQRKDDPRQLTELAVRARNATGS